MEVGTLLALIFGLVGLIFLAVALCLMQIIGKRKAAASGKTLAEVVELRLSRDEYSGGRQCSYRPVYRYYAGNVMHETVSVLSRRPCPVKVGDRVELCYVPGQPEKIYVPSEQRGMRVIAGVFLGFGIGFPVLGLLLFMLI